jgi:inhibitor of cysteine peptidase
MDKRRLIGMLVFLLSAAFCAFAETRIDSRVGEDIVITLQSNPTTGYGWRLAGPLNERIVKLTRRDFVPSRTDLAGAPGKEVWVFRAIGKGVTAIAFEYVRSWEKGVPPAQEESYTVRVR